MTFDLAAWSVWRVLLVTIAWLVLVPALVALYAYVTIVRPQVNTYGSAGIGAVSIGFSAMLPLLALMLWVLPPIALVGVWASWRFGWFS